MSTRNLNRQSGLERVDRLTIEIPYRMNAKLLPLLPALLFAGLASAQSTVFDVIAASEDHTQLEAALILTGLDDVLDDADGTFTVFAPDDDAFADLVAAQPDVLEDSGAVRTLLSYHVLGAEVPSTAIADGQSFANTLALTPVRDSAFGLSLQIVRDADTIYLNDLVFVTEADLAAVNGVVHSIDEVLEPLRMIDVAYVSPAHTTLATALDASPEVETQLEGASEAFNSTLFAPTDAAFAALPDGALEQLLGNEPFLRATLFNHLFTDELPTYFLLGLNEGNPYAIPVRSGAGYASQLYFIDGEFGFKDVPFAPTDIIATDGVVQVVDSVLTLPTVTEFVDFSFQHTTLDFLLDTAGLDSVVNGLAEKTIFAPTDAAFGDVPTETLNALVADLPQLREVLTYHILPEAREVVDFPAGLSFENSAATYSLQFRSETSESETALTVDNAALFRSDYLALDGVIHLPVAVLTPENVVGIAERSPVHATLVTAITEAGLAGTLASDTASFTVFAPTDAAFAALRGGTLDALLADPDGELTELLLYHVLGDSVTAAAIIAGEITSATTLQGETVAIAVDGSGATTLVTVDSATVLFADVIGTNGVVHVIDAVLLPSTVSEVTTLRAAEAGIAVGPIPATDFTTVTIPAELGDRFRLTLVNASGARVGERRLSSGTNHVDLAALPGGTYFMLFEGPIGAYYQALVVR